MPSETRCDMIVLVHAHRPVFHPDVVLLVGDACSCISACEEQTLISTVAIA